MSQLAWTESLHLFSLPTNVIEHLTPRTSTILDKYIGIFEPDVDVIPPDMDSATAGNNALACTLCHNIGFKDVQAQRIHFKSDWHRYNSKLKLHSSKAEAITEAKFSSLLEGLEDSLSGSESSDSDSDGNSLDAVSTLVSQNKIRRSRSNSPSYDSRTLPKSPIIWYFSPNIPNTQFGVYSAVFPTGTPPSASVDELKKMQDGGQDGKLWTLFMIAGGHFAGMVVRVCKPASERNSKTNTSKTSKKVDMEIILHKTFHRYTTRRKQGGSQSVNDNAKGPAKSAGAQLRRYGEQALRDDIRGLMTEWQDEIKLSEKIFIRANVSNKRIFTESEDNIIPKGDDRLRTFPFPTRRPTQSELTRCLLELTRVKISHLSDEALMARDQALLASLPKPRSTPLASASTEPKPKTPAVPKLTKEEEAKREKYRRILEMIRKGRLDSLKTFWEKESALFALVVDSATDAPPVIDTRLPSWLDDPGEPGGAGETFLQIASSAGQDEVVKWLLEDLRADPRITLPSSHSLPATQDEQEAIADTPNPVALTSKTAYDAASNKASRDVFRRCAWSHPDWWDWLGAARVPSTLSPQMEEEQDKKKDVRRKGMRERAKEREAARAKQEAETIVEKPPAVVTPVPKHGPQKLGGISGATKERQSVAGLTPEMRATIERERRARAAEARLGGPAR